MKKRDIIFNILAALAPVLVLSILQDQIKAEKPIVITLIAAIISFVAILLIAAITNSIPNNIKYVGQWVMEFTKGDGDTFQNVGLGIIRYDHKVGEHTFLGKIYDLEGKELFTWSIDALHFNKDNSTEYICITRNTDGPILVGQLRFANEDESEGTVWGLEGGTYRVNGYRINSDMLPEGNPKVNKLRLFFWRKTPILRQEKYSEFVGHYIKTYKKGKM